MEKICKTCNNKKDEKEFYKHRNVCIECTKVENKIRYEKNKEKYLKMCKKYRDAHKEEFNKYYKEYHKKHRNEHLAYNRKHYLNEDRKYIRWATMTLNSHKGNGFIINISKEDLINIIENINVCPICGIKLNFAAGNGFSMEHPSLDRLNNEKEIRKDNVLIVCRRCNVTKLDRTIEEMDMWVNQWIQFREKQKY